MTQRNGLQKTLREKRSGGKRERNRAWHSDGRRRMTCMDAIRGKSSILFHANLANNCCIHVHQCFAPQSSWKFPQLYRFQSAMSFVSGQPQNLDIVAEIFFLLHIETLQGAGGGGGGGGWITVRRKVLAPAPPPFPSLILWIQPCAQWLCPHPGGFWTVCFCLGGEMIVWGGSDNCHYWWTSHSLCWTPTPSQKKVTDMQGLPTNQQILHAPRPNVIFRTYFPM